MNLNIEMLEEKGQALLQDLVLTVHHCFMITLANTAAFKIVENHLGRAHIRQQFFVQQPQMNFNLPPELQAELMREMEEERKSAKRPISASGPPSELQRLSSQSRGAPR